MPRKNVPFAIIILPLADPVPIQVRQVSLRQQVIDLFPAFQIQGGAERKDVANFFVAMIIPRVVQAHICRATGEIIVEARTAAV